MHATVARAAIARRVGAAVAHAAVAVADGQPYQLICLDIRLGDMEGYEVLRRLREREGSVRLDSVTRARVIMTTVIADPGQIMAAFDEQCDAYVVKPITRERLLVRLRDVGITMPEP